MGCFFSCFFSSPQEIVEYEQERERSTESPQEIVEYEQERERSTASPQEIVEYEQERKRSTASPQEIVECEQERERSTAFPREIVEYQHQQERSIAAPKLYDAFISHRGPDVKDTLAKQLYDLLKARRCRAFLDREEIEGGDSISSSISNGICSSVVQIVIFSKGYADSPWCLNELVDMLKQSDALFIPVFYDVEPWELRHIENKKSRYAAAFSHYRSKGRNLDKLDKWKEALADAAEKSGYELRRYQDNLCEKIVSCVLQENIVFRVLQQKIVSCLLQDCVKRLCEKIVSRVLQETDKRRPLYVAEHPVGLAELVQDFERSCSETVKDKAKLVGIYGLGGSGKTTLAKELFNRKRSGYGASCFLSDVRESDTKGELHCLQRQLLKDLFGEDREFRNIAEGIGELKPRLGNARHVHFLIVLDDVDSLQQLRPLLFEDMLSPGSLVIVTTRNQSVLTGADITIRYKMKEMDRDHARELFCSHAFRERDPLFEYENLVESFVEFCGGLPLSLAVLGAHVYRRDKHYWELQLEKVKKIQPEDIMKRLKISFDGLDREEKQIFIDIACCFNKMYEEDMKSKALSIWKASGWSAEHALQTLQDKSLLEVKEGDSYVFIMHDHLRDLGRQMADELGPPRLWKPDVLRSMEAKGFQKILAETKGRCFHEFEDSSLKTRITYFIGSSNDSAETQLLYLDIVKSDGSLKEIPSWIPLRNLGGLSVFGVNELWSTFQQQLQTNTQASFELRNLKISSCGSSQKLPDSIGMFSRLEELLIDGSFKETDLTSFLESLKQLSNLRSLKLEFQPFSGNLNLEGSTSSRMNSLETIDFFLLYNISKLVISGEICPRLRSLGVGKMRNLNEMHLKQLKRLNILSVEDCDELETISGLSSLIGLQSLFVLECNKLETISGLSSLIGLQSLIVGGCDKLETLPGLSSLTGLQSLMVGKCPKLETISGLSSLTGLQLFRAEKCNWLKSLPTLAHLRCLERILIVECHQLQSIEGLEELLGLKSLLIEVSYKEYALVRNCVYGLKRLPLESTVFIRRAGDGASSGLDVNLFSGVIGAQSVAEIERGEYELKMGSSSTAITIYALLVRSSNHIGCMRLNGDEVQGLPYAGHAVVRMITVLLTPHNEGSLRNVSIEKGFVASVNEGEEGKALTVLQTIVDRLFGESMTWEGMYPNSAAYDVVKGKRKQMD